MIILIDSQALDFIPVSMYPSIKEKVFVSYRQCHNAIQNSNRIVSVNGFGCPRVILRPELSNINELSL